MPAAPLPDAAVTSRLPLTVSAGSTLAPVAVTLIAWEEESIAASMVAALPLAK